MSIPFHVVDQVLPPPLLAFIAEYLSVCEYQKLKALGPSWQAEIKKLRFCLPAFDVCVSKDSWGNFTYITAIHSLQKTESASFHSAVQTIETMNPPCKSTFLPGKPYHYSVALSIVHHVTRDDAEERVSMTIHSRGQRGHRTPLYPSLWNWTVGLDKIMSVEKVTIPFVGSSLGNKEDLYTRARALCRRISCDCECSCYGIIFSSHNKRERQKRSVSNKC